MNMQATRGRPAFQMTARRREVRDCVKTHHAGGHLVSLSRIARECGLCDYREARRIVEDLRTMGEL